MTTICGKQHAWKGQAGPSGCPSLPTYPFCLGLMRHPSMSVRKPGVRKKTKMPIQAGCVCTPSVWPSSKVLGRLSDNKKRRCGVTRVDHGNACRHAQRNCTPKSRELAVATVKDTALKWMKTTHQPCQWYRRTRDTEECRHRRDRLHHVTAIVTLSRSGLQLQNYHTMVSH